MTLGGRVFVDSVHMTGTVKWRGILDGSKSERVGVELDKELETAHDGKGVFACPPHRGVFVKLSNVNPGITLSEGIQRKYVNSGTPPPSSLDRFKLVGATEAAAFFKDHLSALEDICVDGMGVSRVDGDHVRLLKMNCVKRLSVCGNLLVDFSEIVQLTRIWPGLEEIDLTDNIGLFLGESCMPDEPSGSNLKRLRVDGCGSLRIDPRVISTCFPKLEELSLKNVPERCFVSDATYRISVESVILANTRSDVVTCNFETQKIRNLDLIHCLLRADAGFWTSLPALLALNVAECGIPEEGSGEWMSLLAEALSHLQSIRVSGNPFYESNPNKWRQIIVTAFPALNLVNGAIVRAPLRRDAERYCVSLIRRGDVLANTVIPEKLKNVLSEKYPVAELPVSSPSAPGIPKTLLALVIRNGQPDGSDLSIRVPRNCRIDDLVATVARRIHWPLKRSELGICAIAPNGSMEDQIKVSEEIGSTLDLSDLGIEEDGWVLITFVKDSGFK